MDVLDGDGGEEANVAVDDVDVGDVGDVGDVDEAAMCRGE